MLFRFNGDLKKKDIGYTNSSLTVLIDYQLSHIEQKK